MLTMFNNIEISPIARLNAETKTDNETIARARAYTQISGGKMIIKNMNMSPINKADWKICKAHQNLAENRKRFT